MNAAVWCSHWWEQQSVTYICFVFLDSSTEETDISPKVLQLIQGEKVKVRKESWSSAAVSTSQALQPHVMPQKEVLIPAPYSQYATPVVKYDRNGFKARERLLVLTQSSAYVVEMAKIKQKIDYATLKGNSANQAGLLLMFGLSRVLEQGCLKQCSH